MSATTLTETFTIHLSNKEAQRLRRVAEIAQRPIDAVVADTLRASLPPLWEDMPSELRKELSVLETWSNADLLKQVHAKYDPAKLARYDELLVMNAERTLAEAERHELTELRAEGDRLMFRKAYAALLLKWRGQRVPSVDELP